MIVDMDGLPMSPGSATALLFRASFKKPLAMRSLPRTNVSSRFLLGPFLTIPVPSQQFLSHVFWMFPEHNKRICDAIFPPWIVVTSHSLYIVEIEPDNIRQEEKTLARLAEMFAYRLDDLCPIVRPCDQAKSTSLPARSSRRATLPYSHIPAIQLLSFLPLAFISSKIL
ncbi:hypothetical protein [Neorhizobium galegae]|nr:hypothetical protein [Neorhizobium galegae]